VINLKTVYISKKKTELLKTEEAYPDGANYPTIVKTYRCFCKKGYIFEEIVRGFNDHIAYLECDKCEEKYATYLDFIKDDWIATLNK